MQTAKEAKREQNAMAYQDRKNGTSLLRQMHRGETVHPAVNVDPQGEESDGPEDESTTVGAKDLCIKAVKWAIKRSHRAGMPDGGWAIALQQQICSCRYFIRFLICAHVLVAHRTRNMHAV